MPGISPYPQHAHARRRIRPVAWRQQYRYRRRYRRRRARAIAINLVIAWRLMVMTLLGREVPELPAEILFSDIEILVLGGWARKMNAKAPTLLGEAVRLVARIGGYANRKHDPPPGHELMWYGYQFLIAMCTGYELRDE